MSIIWEERMRFGVPVIDERHETMFEQFALLNDAIIKGACDDKVRGILDFLNDYANTHFSEEEGLMAVYDYAGLEEQRQQHTVFKENICRLRELLSANVPVKELAIRIDATLIRYTINHVRNLYCRLVEFLKDKREGEPAQL